MDRGSYWFDRFDFRCFWNTYWNFHNAFFFTLDHCDFCMAKWIAASGFVALPLLTVVHVGGDDYLFLNEGNSITFCYT